MTPARPLLRLGLGLGPNVGLTLALALAAALAPHAARAAEPSSPPAPAVSSPEAEALFDEGRTLLDAGRTPEACDRFARSQSIDPAVGTLLNLGECWTRLGRVASAWATYREAVTLARARQDERRAAVAGAAAAALEPRLPRLTLRLADAATPTTLTRDGAAIAPASLGVPAPLDPGEHVLEARAAGRRPWTARVTLAEGEAKELEVPRLALAPTAAIPPAKERSTPSTVVAVGAGAAGGAAWIASLALGGLAASRWSRAEDLCPDARCPDDATRLRADDDASAARGLATASTVTAIVGTAALAVGLVVWLTAPRTSGATASAATFAF